MKVVIAHPEQQHSLKTAEALASCDLLGQYLTTVYYAEGSLTKALAGLLPDRFRAKAAGRRSEKLPEDLVTQLCEAQALVKLLCQNVPKLRRFYSSIRYSNSDAFAVKAARYAIEHEADIVIGYDNTSPVLYEMLERDAPHIVRIQDMTALNTLYMKPIYERDFLLKPDFAGMLKVEQSRVWDDEQLERKRRELTSAQYFLCASTVTRESLVYSGISPDRCLMLPYGVDSHEFSPGRKHAASLPVRFVYVGGTKELKGIAYLLDAFLAVDSSVARLTVVGSNSLSPELLSRYEGTVNFTGVVSHSQLPDLLRTMDAMVFPSLGDGFGLAALEGMSCGLPLVCTDKSGICDCVQDGVNGYVVPAQDERALVKRVNELASDPNRLSRMGEAARATAQAYTWKRYGDSLCRLLQGLPDATDTHD